MSETSREDRATIISPLVTGYKCELQIFGEEYLTGFASTRNSADEIAEMWSENAEISQELSFEQPTTPPEQHVYPPAPATNLMAGPMEQRIAALEAAIAALQARVSELEAERDEQSQGYPTLAEAIAAENEKFIAEQAALGYDAELVASTVLSAPEREFICPVSCARCDKTVEYGELDERGLCHLCVMDLTEDDASPEPLYPKPVDAPAAKAVAPKLTKVAADLLRRIDAHERSGVTHIWTYPMLNPPDKRMATKLRKMGLITKSEGNRALLRLTDLGREALEAVSS